MKRPYVRPYYSPEQVAAQGRQYGAMNRGRQPPKRYKFAGDRYIRAAQLAEQAAVNQSETKYFDTACSNNTVTAGAVWDSSEVPMDTYVTAAGASSPYTQNCLIPTAIGSGYGQVVGNRYKFKSIRSRYTFRFPSDVDENEAPQPITLRAIMIMDTMPNGAQAQGETIMQALGDANTNIHTFMNVANITGKYRILKDKTWTVNPTVSFNDQAGDATGSAAFTGTVGYGQVRWKVSYKPKMPIQVNLKAASATPTVAQTVNFNIFILVMAIQNGVPIGVNCNGANRVYYCE